MGAGVAASPHCLGRTSPRLGKARTRPAERFRASRRSLRSGVSRAPRRGRSPERFAARRDPKAPPGAAETCRLRAIASACASALPYREARGLRPFASRTAAAPSSRPSLAPAPAPGGNRLVGSGLAGLGTGRRRSVRRPAGLLPRLPRPLGRGLHLAAAVAAASSAALPCTFRSRRTFPLRLWLGRLPSVSVRLSLSTPASCHRFRFGESGIHLWITRITGIE